MKKEYTVSAIVSVYNCRRFLEGRLQNLEDQTLAGALEIVVVDSGSGQNEVEIVREFQKRYNNIVYLRTESRETIYQAWNRGIRAASSRYVTNANADDRLRADALEVMARTLDEDPGADIVYSDIIMTDRENDSFEECRPMGFMNFPDNGGFSSLDAFWLYGTLGPMPLWRKSLHERFGWFDETLEVAGDMEYWLRVAGRCRFRHVRDYLGLYLYNPSSAERRNFEITAMETIEAARRHLSRAGRKALGDVRRSLAEKCADLANYYVSRGRGPDARALCRRGIGYDWLYGGSYRYWLASFFPLAAVTGLKALYKLITVVAPPALPEYRRMRRNYLADNPRPRTAGGKPVATTREGSIPDAARS
jgi:glycosyltransferase involved in cell wall biosynthesis